MLSLLAVGIAIGLLLGLTGAGGSVMAVPLLVLVAGIEPHAAAATSLAAVAIAAATGAWARWRHRELPLRLTLVFVLAGAPFAALGVYVASQVSAARWLPLFACLMLLVAARMAWQLLASPRSAGNLRAGDDQGNSRPARCMLASDGHFRLTARCVRILLLAGALSGFVAGFFGVGGGFVIVPALTLLAGLSTGLAVASSLLVIALLGGITFLFHLAQGSALPPATLLPVVAGAIAGMLSARAVAGRLGSVTLQALLATVIAALALYLLLVR